MQISATDVKILGKSQYETILYDRRMWELLLTNKGDFIDNRKKGSLPEFVHKDSSYKLYMADCPEDILDDVSKLKGVGR